MSNTGCESRVREMPDDADEASVLTQSSVLCGCLKAAAGQQKEEMQ